MEGYLADMKSAMIVMAGVITTLAGVVAALFLIYKRDNLKNKEELVTIIKEDIATKKDIHQSMENNNKLIKELPDAIVNAIRLSIKP